MGGGRFVPVVLFQWVSINFFKKAIMTSANCDKCSCFSIFTTFIYLGKLFNLPLTGSLFGRMDMRMVPSQMVPVINGLLCELSENQKVLEAVPKL